MRWFSGPLRASVTGDMAVSAAMPSGGHVVDDDGAASRTDASGTFSNYIRDRPIFDLCLAGERQRGTRPRKWWWDQEINVDLESEEDSSSVVSEDH